MLEEFYCYLDDDLKKRIMGIGVINFLHQFIVKYDDTIAEINEMIGVFFPGIWEASENYTEYSKTGGVIWINHKELYEGTGVNKKSGVPS